MPTSVKGCARVVGSGESISHARRAVLQWDADFDQGYWPFLSMDWNNDCQWQYCVLLLVPFFAICPHGSNIFCHVCIDIICLGLISLLLVSLAGAPLESPTCCWRTAFLAKMLGSNNRIEYICFSFYESKVNDVVKRFLKIPSILFDIVNIFCSWKKSQHNSLSPGFLDVVIYEMHVIAGEVLFLW